MQVIELSSIVISPERQRQEFNEKDIVELSNSIKDFGLLHAPVVQNDGVTLVSGERRLRAIEMLHQLGLSILHDGSYIPPGYVPVVTMSELSEAEYYEAELEENIRRKNLTWQEESSAIAKLHKLRAEQKGAQTYKSTAEEILGLTSAPSSAQMHVRAAVIVAENMQDDDVAGASSLKDALKVIQRKKQDQLTDELARMFNMEQTKHTFLCADFRDVVSEIPTSSIDVIITDPPYGINAQDFGSQLLKGHEYEDSEEYFKEVMEVFAAESVRVTEEKAHLYLFCDQRNFSYLSQLLEHYGWDVWPTSLIWAKSHAYGLLPRPHHGPRRTYEHILYAIKGNKRTTAVYADVASVQAVSKPRFGAEKPWELYENLLKRSCYPGDVIWDPFAGAGPVFPAANALNLTVFASELDETKFKYAKLRMYEQEVETT